VQKYEKGVNRVNANRLVEVAKALRMQAGDFYGKAEALDLPSLIDVTDKDTLRMLRAYGRIKDQATQRQIVVVIETIAAADDATKE
jgi:hypothetical protein